MSTRNIPRNNIGEALRRLRTSKGLSQEHFGDVSSRTYVSVVERGLKHPTLSKLDEIASEMQVHPLTLLTLAYAGRVDIDNFARIQERVASELQEYLVSQGGTPR
jgi:transcriptional regulator with XRE-family HTH domain